MFVSVLGTSYVVLIPWLKKKKKMCVGVFVTFVSKVTNLASLVRFGSCSWSFAERPPAVGRVLRSFAERPQAVVVLVVSPLSNI